MAIDASKIAKNISEERLPNMKHNLDILEQHLARLDDVEKIREDLDTAITLRVAFGSLTISPW